MLQTAERPTLSPDADMLTGQIPAVSEETEIAGSKSDIDLAVGLLPPVDPEMYTQHDLAAEADDTPTRSVPLSPYDAVVVSHALMNQSAAEWVETMYGRESVQRTLDKARAIADVNIYRAHTSAAASDKLYGRLAKGAVPDEFYADLYARIKDQDAFTERPIHEIGDDSLGFDLEESRVVFEALRMTALHPHPGRENDEDIAARDLLSRYAPFRDERAFYAALLTHAGIDLSKGNAIEYPYPQG